MKTEEEIKDAVEKFINDQNLQMEVHTKVIDHIKDMCISILQTKYGVGYPGGGFVQAVVNNDLMGAFGRADSINKNYIGLYVKLLYNY
jgi:hypothetical protein